MIEAAVAKAIEQHVASHGKGSVPAPLAKQASELLHKPVDPCRELAAMTKYAVDTIAGFGEFTYACPSNRQIPGGCLLPSSVKPIPRITLIIDSSGSMGSDDTALALEVLGNVLKHLPDPRGCGCWWAARGLRPPRRYSSPGRFRFWTAAEPTSDHSSAWLIRKNRRQRSSSASPTARRRGAAKTGCRPRSWSVSLANRAGARRRRPGRERSACDLEMSDAWEREPPLADRGKRQPSTLGRKAAPRDWPLHNE